jgi:tetratricopeptide (TPR) repeat protein
MSSTHLLFGAMNRLFQTLSVITLLTLGSCRDSFFDEYPQDQFTEAGFYKRASDFEQALNAGYRSLQSSYSNFYSFGDIASDDSYNWKKNNNSQLIQFNESTVTSNNGIISGQWSSHFATIARANIVLSRIGGVSMEETLKKRYEGEARFLRALMYFNLVRIFGDVPLITKEITDAQESFAYGRDPADKVYELIISDLTTAAQYLPDAYTQNIDIGRATSLAAKSLLGKVYLTQKRYPEAVTKLKEVIASGKAGLMPNYNDFYNPDLPNNKEIIFAVQYARNFDPTIGSPFGNIVAPNEPVDRPIVTVGNGAGQFFLTTDLLNSFELGDLRKTAIDSAVGQRKYYFTKKYFDPKMAKANDAANDWPILRYADVLLMTAEALNESGNPTEALLYLNPVRKRAGLGELSGLPQGPLRLVLERERRVELNSEGQRWFDLVRTGRAKDVMNAFFVKYKSDDDQAGQNSSLQDNELIFPVPKFQVDLNPDRIKQNPGY